MKKERSKKSVYRGATLSYPSVCWEEADYADECLPSTVKKQKIYRSRRDDSLVDFSDVVRN